MAETGDHRPALCSPALLPPAPADQQQEHLQCPRCESTNTKFCYYNNYNLSQPRHFCKNCRRYWTKGGALRNIPVGGGSRKSSAKRYRSLASADAPPATSVSLTPEASPRVPLSATPMTVDFGFGHLIPSSAAAYGGFLSLGAEPLLSRAGFGLGFARPGLEEMMGLGLTARAMFSTALTPEMVHSGGNSWHLSSAGDGFSDAGDCFSWPELAISAPGKGLP